ncbi:hypothetical protein MKX03_025940, partial [Papaver bracteatum]
MAIAMNSDAVQQDEGGWEIFRSKKEMRASKGRSFLNKKGLCCWIEAKGFSITKGFGSKSGKFQLIESKGDRFSTLWINQKGLSWFRNGLKAEIKKVWSKAQSWKFNDSDEWLISPRGKNSGGEFIKLSGPNSWGNTVDIYVPSGKDGDGWNQIITIIDQLIKPVEKPLSDVAIPLHTKNPVWVVNPKS